MDAGHLTTQQYDMRCEILRESGTIQGKLQFSLTEVIQNKLSIF